MKKSKTTKEQELPSAVDDAAEVMSSRQKILLARKKNLQRRKRSKLPNNLKWDERNCHIKKDMTFVRNVLTLLSFGKPANYVGVLCPSKLKYDG